MTDIATTTAAAGAEPAIVVTPETEPERRRREVLGPLVKLVLNARLVSLFLVIMATPVPTAEASLLLVLMAATSVVPVLLWPRLGAWILRHPAASSIDLLVAATCLVVAPDTVIALYAITTAILTGVLYGRLGGTALTVPLLLAYVLGVVQQGIASTFASLVLLPLLLTCGGLFGAELRRLLVQRDEALEIARRSLERAAVAEERARLSRELHDSVAKTVHGLALSAASVPLLAEEHPELAAAQVQAIRDAAERATTETRQVLSGLRIDDPSVGFATSIRQAVEHWGASRSTAVTVDADDAAEPALEVRYELFQMLREALHNTAKHADADRVEVTLTTLDDGIELAVRDDGRGFDVPDDVASLARSGHIGVVGFHERAAGIGGQVTLTSAPGAGTHVVIRAPLSAPRGDTP